MGSPGEPPISSSNSRNNGAGSSSSSDLYDEEEGEPPSIPPPDNRVKTSTRTIVTFSRPHGRLKTMGRRGCRSRKIQRRISGSSWVSMAVMATYVAIFLCHPTWLCAAENAVLRVSALGSEENPGIRGASHHSGQESDTHSPSDSCSYECCSTFVDDVLSQSQHGRSQIVGHENTEEFRMRMLQASNALSVTNTTNSSSAPIPCTPENEPDEGGVGLPVWAQYIIIVILVLFSALFSGLTLGLMSLDPSGLEIVMANSDDPDLARAAKAIYPVRLNGNLLLCTLLLGNVGVNALLSILMADLTSGLVGFIVSTCVIVVFGEIIPQAICSRFALQIGEKTVPLVKIIIVLLYPICKPLSYILNKVLGHEIGTTYSTSEMAKLIEMHVLRGELEGATGAAMTGALHYRTVAVSEVMTPLMNTFMLSSDERLGFDTVAKIFKTGYSRIPVYEVSKSNIIGLLFVKDLIFVDPEDEIPVKNFVQIFGRGLHVVWPDDKLGGVLKLLKRGGSHMALVRGVNDGDGKVDPYYEIRGIITLEDIIEIILGDEIVDETDALVDVNDPNSVVRRSDLGDYIIEGALESTGRDSPVLGGGVSASNRPIDWEARLRLLDERLVDEHLSSDEIRAVAAHLKTNYSKAVELISDRQLKEVLSLVPVTEISPASSCTTADGGDEGSGVPTDCAELIYQRGVPADFCTVVLSGKIMVMSGADKFRSDVSNWGVLASRALTDPGYVPDFSAWVLPNQNSSGGCRCVKLDCKSYAAAVDNTALERTDHNVNQPKPAVSMSTVITTESPLVLNGNASKSSLSQRQMKSTSILAPVVDLAPKKVSSADQIDSTSTQPTTNQLPPQTPDDVVNVEHTTSSYVRTDLQKKTHSRRSKLLKAFTHAKGRSEEEEP